MKRLFLAWGFGFALQAGAADWSLIALMEGRQTIRAETAHFSETKTSHLLTRPIKATGTLTYAAPDKLEKITLAPTPETIRLDGETLTGIRADGEEFSLDIGSQSEVASLVEGIRSTLAGDLITLRRHYEIGFDGAREHWRLDLEPRNGRVRGKVERISVSGSGLQIGVIEVFETDGDHSEMTISP